MLDDTTTAEQLQWLLAVIALILLSINLTLNKVAGKLEELIRLHRTSKSKEDSEVS